MGWARAWNDNAPGLSFAKGLRVKSLNLYDVETTPGFRFFGSRLLRDLCRNRHLRKNRAQARVSGAGKWRPTPDCGGPDPAKLFEALLSLVCLGWGKRGMLRAIQAKTADGTFLLKRLCGFLIFSAVSFAVGRYLVPWVPFTNLVTPLYYLTLLPALSFGVGFCLGLMLPESTLSSLGIELSAEQGASRSTPTDRRTSGFVLGKTPAGQDFKLTERNLGYHVEMIAPMDLARPTCSKI